MATDDTDEKAPETARTMTGSSHPPAPDMLQGMAIKLDQIHEVVMKLSDEVQRISQRQIEESSRKGQRIAAIERRLHAVELKSSNGAATGE